MASTVRCVATTSSMSIALDPKELYLAILEVALLTSMSIRVFLLPVCITDSVFSLELIGIARRTG